MRLALTAFTQKGVALALRLAADLEGEGHRCSLHCPVRLGLDLPGYESLALWTGEQFSKVDGLLFVGASGIAVRAIAPYIKDKFTDPAVVSVDEGGRFAVPLLSGHVGGANHLARRVAALTGGEAAISTATDVNGLFAVDQWASQQGLFLESREAAKHVSVALLAGKTVGLESDFPIVGRLPKGIQPGEAELGIACTINPAATPFPETLRLIPPILNVGVGCRRGTEAEAIAKAVDGVLEANGLSPRAVRQLCTIDLKKDEAGLLSFCRGRSLPLKAYTPEELLAVPGTFTPSEFVRGVTGVDNVCERAAVCAGGELILPKQAGGGVTVAVSRLPFTISFVGENI